MNRLVAAFSPQGTLGRRAYWVRMVCVTACFVVLLHSYLFSLMVLHLEKMWYPLLLFVPLLLAGFFAIPSGFLAALLWVALMHYADPSSFPHTDAQGAWLCGGLMLLSALGMLALNAYGFALAAQRLRSAGISPWMLLLGLIPGAFIILAGLYCFRRERAGK